MGSAQALATELVPTLGSASAWIPLALSQNPSFAVLVPPAAQNHSSCYSYPTRYLTFHQLHPRPWSAPSNSLQPFAQYSFPLPVRRCYWLPYPSLFPSPPCLLSHHLRHKKTPYC